MTYLQFLFKKIILHIKSFLFQGQNYGSADSYKYKWERIKGMASKYGAKTFVETGSYYGLTIDKMQNSFKTIHSIEVDDILHSHNNHFYRKNNQIKIHLGDSKNILPSVLENLSEEQKVHPLVFWLDGHCSENETGIGEEYSPLAAEIKTITQDYRNLTSIILIDDVRLFDGINYPTLDEVKNIAKDNYQIFEDQDALVLLDKNLC
jgi:hypothetical protein